MPIVITITIVFAIVGTCWYYITITYYNRHYYYHYSIHGVLAICNIFLVVLAP